MNLVALLAIAAVFAFVSRRQLRLIPLVINFVVLIGSPTFADQVTFNYTSFDPPQAVNTPIGSSQAIGISNTGEIVGAYWTGTNFANATDWGYTLQNGIYTSLIGPSAGNGSYNGTYAMSVNSAGFILFEDYDNVVDFNTSGHVTSWLYNPGTMTYGNIAFPGAVTTFAYQINDAGIVTGSYDDGTTSHGFQYNMNTNTYTMLPDVLGSTATFGLATNVNGSSVVNYTDASGSFRGPIFDYLNQGGFDSAIYQNGLYSTVDFPGALSTFADGINAAGFLSGGYVTEGNGLSGLFFDGTTWYSLDYPGAAKTNLFQINDDQQMAGEWIDATGEFHSLLVDAVTVTVPEPSSLWLLVVGCLSLGLRRSRPTAA
jgi:hypothetical protein